MPALKRINKQTGQENDARFLAYMIEHVFNEVRAMKDRKEPA